MKLNKFEIDNLIKDNALLKERVKELKLYKEALTKQLSIQGVINWVALKDKKPEFGGFYLCCLENGHVTEVMYEFFNNVWHRNNQEIKQHNKLVYWAEIPKPPCL